jgi:demethylmenaquinone methyltransferase/2-methoxy-6-polyprenyl-1,4-benzoquinol methylase
MKTEFLENSTTAHFLFKLMARVMENPLRRKINDPVRALKAAGIRSGIKALEVGCGTGFFTIPAAKLVGNEGQIHALDIHPLAIKQVSSKIQAAGLENVSLTKANAVHTELSSDSFDLILLFGVIPSPTLPLSQLLPEMHRLLKENGTMAVWTTIPFYLVKSVTRGKKFTYVGKKSGVYKFKKLGACR